MAALPGAKGHPGNITDKTSWKTHVEQEWQSPSGRGGIEAAKLRRCWNSQEKLEANTAAQAGGSLAPIPHPGIHPRDPSRAVPSSPRRLQGREQQSGSCFPRVPSEQLWRTRSPFFPGSHAANPRSSRGIMSGI